jgi:hypothetical protein
MICRLSNAHRREGIDGFVIRPQAIFPRYPQVPVGARWSQGGFSCGFFDLLAHTFIATLPTRSYSFRFAKPRFEPMESSSVCGGKQFFVSSPLVIHEYDSSVSSIGE